MKSTCSQVLAQMKKNVEIVRQNIVTDCVWVLKWLLSFRISKKKKNAIYIEYYIKLYLLPFSFFFVDICCFWISKLLYLDFQILLTIEVVTRLSHD